MMLLAQTTASTPEPRYGFATLGPLLDQPGAALAACGLGVLLIAAIVFLYWRERTSLSPLRMLPLLLLRLGAVAGVVVYALAPEKRDARQETRPSRVLLLVDDSLSMSLPSSLDDSAAAAPSRTQAVLALLDERRLLGELRKTHELHVAATSAPRAAEVFPLLTGKVRADEKDTQPDEGPTLADRLAAKSAETRLGDAIEQTAALSAGGPLAAVVLISDGQNNSGANPELAAAASGESGVPVHAIGLGSETPAKNLLIRDLVAPSRAYPKDEIQIAAVIETQGFAGGVLNASLYARSLGGNAGEFSLLETKSPPIDTAASSESFGTHTISFTARPQTAGGIEYRVTVAPLPGEQDTEDNSATAEVQVVDRLLKVLLVAGGPTRDYHFLRDQLRRDDSFAVDVLLQSAPPGVSQDADNVLSSFPSDQEKLDAYDLFIAFDADWTAIPRESVEAIEQRVAQRGAGFLFATGPVHTPRWLRESGSQPVLDLLPIKPAAAPLLLGPTERSAPEPAPVALTRAGREASMLWVLGEQQASLDFWEALPGFYSTADVETIKPGAVVYAEAAPRQGFESKLPRVVFAEQFFGAGRSFYIGAPELWRLRSEDPAAMRAFYTKLLQHLSQGRLLVDSPAGSLLFERDRYSVGDTLTLRATLTDAALAELGADAGLTVQLELPGGRVVSLPLTRAESAGAPWTTSLRAESEGAYRATLAIAGLGEPLVAKTRVRVPALERSRTERDGALLQSIATLSGGGYYATQEAVLEGAGDLPPLADAIPSRTETLTIYGAPDEAFARRVSQWLLGLIAGCLLLEWTARRAMSLA